MASPNVTRRDSDISPMTVVPSTSAAQRPGGAGDDYFSAEAKIETPSEPPRCGVETDAGASAATSPEGEQQTTECRKASVSFPAELPRPDHSSTSEDGSTGGGRKGSMSSVSLHRHCQGFPRSASGSRMRASSPPPESKRRAGAEAEASGESPNGASALVYGRLSPSPSPSPSSPTLPPPARMLHEYEVLQTADGTPARLSRAVAAPVTPTSDDGEPARCQPTHTLSTPPAQPLLWPCGRAAGVSVGFLAAYRLGRFMMSHAGRGGGGTDGCVVDPLSPLSPCRSGVGSSRATTCICVEAASSRDALPRSAERRLTSPRWAMNAHGHASELPLTRHMLLRLSSRPPVFAEESSPSGHVEERPPGSPPHLALGRRRATRRGGNRGTMAALTETSDDRFQHHVGFDNVPNGEATKHNTLSLTLNVKHKGYQARRRSRTFMVGIDEHSYSGYAIQWLLDELVDDGDEIVCVRVIEKEIRYNDKQYQDDANQVMDGILEKNGANRAISFILEYAVGKLHATFQKLIQMYQPAMLIVGTRGRSLGGIQGLVNSRNSFSKYCLQYSPVPVVVVRPTEKRIKKKAKRANDATRQTYLGMLSATRGRHEADNEASGAYELETKNSPDEEAHQVAKVLGLPAKFDPTIKPISPSLLPPRSRPSSPQPAASEFAERGRAAEASPSSERGEGDSDEENDDDDGEFDVVDGRKALDQQQKMDQLHKMEVGEAAALKMRVDEDETDESSEKSVETRESKGAS
ncbi:hypothetical protein RJ55_01174 [Drechmeria coniospora]|nr:hypothetical protein RJ55_01174 [Drechmeria coniospora]